MKYGAVTIASLIFDEQQAARVSLVPEDVSSTATGGVHGEHDVSLRRPLVAGEALRTSASLWGTRPAGRNALVTLRYETVDTAGAVVAEQWWTTVYLGTTCAPTGAVAPEHAFPEDARSRPIGEWRVEVTEAMARRYAEDSGDWSPHHFDVEAARRSGADRPFLHGLCTMALCGNAVAEVAGQELRRVAVRFAAPMPLGEMLTVHVYNASELGYAFEADCNGTMVITNGRAEIF